MSSSSKIAVIGGTGLKDLPGFEKVRARWVITRYGWLKVKEKDNIIFLLRHGFDYKAPHRINMRANIMALKQRGATSILALAACGSLKKDVKPGDLATLSDFIDFTRTRIATFEPRRAPRFIDMSEPYDKKLNEKIVKAARSLKLNIHENLVYACAEGPRFETKAEIKAYQTLGCDVVGMTQVPEVILAKEAGIPYAVLAVATNYAAGLQSKISDREVAEMMEEKSEKVWEVVIRVCREL